MKIVNPSTSLRVNGERPSTPLGTSPEFIEGRSRTIKFYTLGCKVNQYDTQSMRESFIQAGFKELGDGLPADVYVINTCTVTHKADRESLNLIRKAKRENPRAKIIVTGCLAELDEDRIRKQRGISLISKNRDKEKIVSRLFRLYGKTKRLRASKGIFHFKGHTRAFLKIQDGCDNFCSYCKVPYVRGLSRSRLPDEIIDEATRLAENGFKEIVLCGICLGAYGQDLSKKSSLVNLIEALQNIEGLFRIRLSSIEAGDISDKLIDKIAESNKFCRHLHIPIQSGDDGILKKMNRKYSSGDYLKLIQKIKSRIPEIAITTDVMVGFPDENTDNFQNTVKLIKEFLPLKTHIFPYSRREGTKAAAQYEQDLDPKIIKERLESLKKVASACSFQYQKQFLNKKMEILVEERPKYKLGFWGGYTDNYIKVLFKSGLKLKNELITVKLKKITDGYVLAQT